MNKKKRTGKQERNRIKIVFVESLLINAIQIDIDSYKNNFQKSKVLVTYSFILIFGIVKVGIAYGKGGNKSKPTKFKYK